MCVFLFACVWLITDSIIVLYHILCLTTTLLFHLQICFSSTSLTFFSFSITVRIISLSFTTSSFFISVMPVSPDIQYIHRLLWFLLTRSILFPFAWTPSYLSICGNFPQFLRSLLFASSFDLPVSLCLSPFGWLLSVAKSKSADVSYFSNGFLEGIKPALFNWLTICTLSAQVCHLFYLW